MLFQRFLSLSFLLFFADISGTKRWWARHLHGTRKVYKFFFFLGFSSLFFLCPYLSDFSDAYGRESADLVE